MIYLIFSAISTISMIVCAVKGDTQSTLFYWLCTMALIGKAVKTKKQNGVKKSPV